MQLSPHPWLRHRLYNQPLPGLWSPGNTLRPISAPLFQTHLLTPGVCCDFQCLTFSEAFKGTLSSFCLLHAEFQLPPALLGQCCEPWVCMRTSPWGSIAWHCCPGPMPHQVTQSSIWAPRQVWCTVMTMSLLHSSPEPQAQVQASWDHSWGQKFRNTHTLLICTAITMRENAQGEGWALGHTFIECLLDARHCSGVGVTKIDRVWSQPLHS